MTHCTARAPVRALVLLAALAAACGREPTAPPPASTDPVNTPPVAAAGADLSVSVGVPVTLDGTQSTDADGDPITYAWSFTSRPDGSRAAFDDPASDRPSFMPDVEGSYGVQLVVDDGTSPSPPDALTISAADNTSTETIGAAGGSIVASDGAMTLEIPAGALSADTEIRMTRVGPHQYPEELTDLGPDDVVYELQPSGLQFATPATVAFTVPASATLETEELDAPVVIVTTLSEGVFEAAEGQVVTANEAMDGFTVAGRITHFSWTTAVLLEGGTLPDGGAPLNTRASAGVPDAVPVGESFEVWVTIIGLGLGVTIAEAAQTDASISPLAPAPAFESAFAPSADGTWESRNTYVCLDAGRGTYHVRIAATFSELRPHHGPAPQTIVVDLVKEVECVAPPDPFTSIDAPAAELVALFRSSDPLEPEVVGVARRGGATLAGATTGELRVRLDGIDPSATVFGLEGTIDDGAIAYASDGLYQFLADFAELERYPWDGAFTKSDLSAAGSANDTRVTDVMMYDARSGRWAAVHHDDQVLTFGEIRDGTLRALPPFTDVWFDDQGEPVLGDRNPVSVALGEGGPDDPFLLGTVARDGSGTSELLHVQIVGGTVVATPVPDVVPARELRQVRCERSVCAASSFGTPFGFGGMTFFSWDGQDGFDFVIGRAARAIGFDMITVGDEVRVASTSYDSDQWVLDRLSRGGDYLGFEFLDVPVGCAGPTDAQFVGPVRVLISCNVSGNVVEVTVPVGTPSAAAPESGRR